MPAEQSILAVLIAVLTVVLVLALVQRWTGRLVLVGAALLGLASLSWLLASPVYEGPSVLTLTPSRGLTISDLGVPPGLLVSAAVLYTVWRDRRA